MCFSAMAAWGSGLKGYRYLETFNCIIINSVMSMEKIVIDHVDVSSWGISLRGGLNSQSLT